MRPLLAAAFLFLFAPVLAQQPQGARERMFADVEFLSSPPLQGRVSLERGAEVAAWFIAAEMRKAGLQPAAGSSYLQQFGLVPVRLDRERSSIRVTVGGAERSFDAASVFFPDPSRAIDLEQLDVVFAGYGVTAPEFGYDDYAGLDAKGKAVLVFDHEPDEDNPDSVFHGRGLTLHANVWTKTLNAQRHGASALLVLTQPVNAHRSSPRSPNRANAPPQGLAPSELDIPRFFVTLEAAEALLQGSGAAAALQSQIDRSTKPASRALPGVKVSLKAVNADTTPRPSWNVAGLLPGTDPRLRDETILIVAHYDHLGDQEGRRYPGANDNGSGVAALLEAARAMAREKYARTVLFLAVGSEEQMMLGSYYYVANPLRPLATTRAVINLDMIGRNEEHTPESEGAYEVTGGRSNQLNLVGAVFSPDLTALLHREAKQVGMTLSEKFDRDSSMRALFRCDHLPFLQKGIPAVWLFSGFHSGYHEPVDTTDLLDFDKMERVVRLTVRAAGALASSATPPPKFRY
ncbi:MAG: M20/M25/M40 family metallo-hydrolase [Vicinamibacterales bacterium]